MFLRQGTSTTIHLGPFVDKTDAVTPLAGIGSMNVKLSQNGGSLVSRASGAAPAHDADGYYLVALDASDTGAAGALRVCASDTATHLPVWRDFVVVPADVYDAILAGTTPLPVDVARWAGVAAVPGAIPAVVAGRAGGMPLLDASGGVALAASETIYPAEIQLTIDAANARDEYTVTWFANGNVLTSGVASPTLEVVRRADASTLIAPTAMADVGASGACKYDAVSAGQRLVAGEVAIVTVRATIDGSPRTWRRLISRDS